MAKFEIVRDEGGVDIVADDAAVDGNEEHHEREKRQIAK